MSRVESNTEGKLRAACERCRELKNRCTRTGDHDSRCDRCERLDIDCVYATNARMGRPRCQRPTLERSGPSRVGVGVGAGASERSARSRRSPSFQSSGRSVRLDHADSGSENGSGSANIHPMLDMLDSALLPDGMHPLILCDSGSAVANNNMTSHVQRSFGLRYLIISTGL